MNFNTPFQFQSQVSIEADTKVVFVADIFAEQYSGGAELTTDALIQKCPYKYQKVFAKDVSVELLENGHHAFWILVLLEQSILFDSKQQQMSLKGILPNG